MEIVIKLSDKYKASLLEGSLTNDQILEVYRAARRGVILPKGHGRIADIDEAIKCVKDVNADDAIWAISLIEAACGKRIILEAESEE